MKRAELLAPAGNFDALKAAVENGADAVYIGGEKFSARQNADNFDAQTMQAALKYAHERGRKVYCAMNTLITNSEVDAFLHAVYDLAEAGIDGVIVQDMGVAHLLREVLPEMRLHGSTQMAVHNSAGVRYLQELGFKRAVLARETSLADIKAIIAQNELEIETFVHGALCVAYSGQCLLSSMIGGRSGNRGQCAQPCRQKYQLLDGAGREVVSDIDGAHLLSTRDLNLLAHLPELLSSGIASLKIEGRMKRPEYVAVVVGAYRRAIDQYYSTGAVTIPQADQRDIRQIFNRDFTDGYYFRNNGRELMSYVRPDNRGVYLGKITDSRGQKITVSLAQDLHNGDGYLFYDAKGQEIAGKVREMMVKGRPAEAAQKGESVTFAAKAGAKNQPIYKTSDRLLLERALATFAQPSAMKKSIVDFAVTVKLGQPLALAGRDSAGNSAFAQSEYIVEAAQKHPSDAEGIQKQLDRLGNTAYALGQVDIALDNGVLAPSSELNKLRRQVIAQLEAALPQQSSGYASLADFEDEAYDFLSIIPPKMAGYARPELAVMTSTPEGAQAAVDNGADIILLNTGVLRPQTPWNATTLAETLALAKDAGKRIYLAPQAICEEKELSPTEALMAWAKNSGFDGILAANVGILQLAKEQGWQDIAIDYTMNVFNDLTIHQFSLDEAVRMTLSPELNLQQIDDLSAIGNVPVEVIVHGNFPLMVSKQCVAGSLAGARSGKNPCQMPCRNQSFALKDRLGMVFPLAMDRHCRMYVYNSKDLNLYKRLAEILATGVDVIRIEAKERDGRWIGAVTASYRAALDRYLDGEKIITNPKDEAQLDALSPQGSTYGHYFRGVL